MFFNKKEECTTTGNNNLLVGVIVVLAIVIAVMWFFLWKMSSWWATSVWLDGVKYDKLSIKVITDSRDTSVDVNNIVNEIKLLPSISWAEIKMVKFEDKGIKDYMLENNIKTLPAFIFSTNNFDVSKDPAQAWQNGQPMPKINTYLQALPNWEFFLEVGATYDPFVERSDRGFRMLTKEQLESLQKDIYVKWNAESKITWFEYSELECPYCARHFKSNTSKEILEKYPNDVNLVFQHFPLYFHNNAELASQILECIGSQLWSKWFYATIEKSFTDAETKADGNINTATTSSKTYLVDEAVKFGADKAKLEKCIDDKAFASKVTSQMQTGTDLFGITWTPGNVLVNTETLEYEIISGAYPATAFIELIDRLK